MMAEKDEYDYYETKPFPVHHVGSIYNEIGSLCGLNSLFVDCNVNKQIRNDGMVAFRQGKSPKDKDESYIQCLKYLLFIFNLVFFLIGCMIVGVGIWLAVDRNFMATISNSPIIEVAAYLFIAGGALVMIIAFFGCCGSVTDNKTLLTIPIRGFYMFYFAALVFIFLLLLIAGILAIVFRSQLGGAVRDTMRKTLKENYGVKQYDDFNRAVTYAWDKAQERMFCCGVDDNGWQLYRESQWFMQFGAEDGIEGQIQGSEDQKPYVPRSCCVRDRFYRYVDRETCTKWRFGPPAQQDGAINRALYYTGCYTAGKHYVVENSSLILGFGFTLLICMISGIIFSFLLLRKMPSE